MPWETDFPRKGRLERAKKAEKGKGAKSYYA
jgi:hypothetical protein